MPDPTPHAAPSVSALPEHAKVVDRVSDLGTRIGELRRHL